MECLQPWALDLLACPLDQARLAESGEGLTCANGHRYPVVDGIPVLLPRPIRIDPPAPQPAGDGAIDPWVQRNILGTSGNLYRGLADRWSRYPIPEFPMPASPARTVLDVGCGWGRWSFAAARAGHRVIAVDHAVSGVRAARRVAAQLGLSPLFVIADARALPVAPRAIDTVFSYSVLQHLSDADFDTALEQIARVLKPDGETLVQVAGRFGARGLMHQAGRGFRQPTGDEVRYRSVPAVRASFNDRIGPSSVEPESFFSLNARPEDLDLLPLHARAVVRASQAAKAMADWVPALTAVADSVWIRSRRATIS